MTDDQCNLIIEAIKGLTLAMIQVSESVDNIYSYNDTDLVKQVNIVAQVIEDIGCRL